MILQNPPLIVNTANDCHCELMKIKTLVLLGINMHASVELLMWKPDVTLIWMLKVVKASSC